MLYISPTFVRIKSIVYIDVFTVYLLYAAGELTSVSKINTGSMEWGAYIILIKSTDLYMILLK